MQQPARRCVYPEVQIQLHKGIFFPSFFEFGLILATILLCEVTFNLFELLRYDHRETSRTDGDKLTNEERVLPILAQFKSTKI